MKWHTILATVLAVSIGAARASDDPVGPKVFQRALESAVLLCWSNHGSDGAWPRAGAVVLDREKRLLLAAENGVPDATFVLFPLYTAKGELRNDPNDYAVPAKAEERWKGKVVHRDKVRGLAVIELDRALPDRAREAEFAAGTAKVESVVYGLGQPPDEKVMWGLVRGTVRAVGKDLLASTGPGSDTGPRPTIVLTTFFELTGKGPQCGLFDVAGRVVALADLPADVTEIRAFLTEKKVPFRSAPTEPAARETKNK